MNADDRVVALRALLIETLTPLLRAAPVAALIDFPDHANVGDSAIYLGELACLRALGIPFPRYTCDLAHFDAHSLRKAAPTGTILLAGGGNFGDVWPGAQRLREAVVRAFPDRRIIQLPQSIHFSSSAALRNARTVLSAHPDFTLLVRDRRSQAIAHDDLGLEAILCPDLALGLGVLARPIPPVRDVLWLSRTDHEQHAQIPAATADDIHQADWLSGDASALRTLTRVFARGARLPVVGRATARLQSRACAPLAQSRLNRGTRLLASARAVVTDRLHGHLLCLMQNIPHVLLDNSYGKLSSFHETWTRDIDGVHFAADIDEAITLARKLASESPRWQT